MPDIGQEAGQADPGHAPAEPAWPTLVTRRTPRHVSRWLICCPVSPIMSAGTWESTRSRDAPRLRLSQSSCRFRTSGRGVEVRTPIVR